jgi:hypothetical protein
MRIPASALPAILQMLRNNYNAVGLSERTAAETKEYKESEEKRTIK